MAPAPAAVPAPEGKVIAGLLDRRELIRTGALLAAVAGAGLPRLGAPEGAAAAAGSALSPGRRSTYRALLTVLGEAPHGRFRHREAVAGTKAFAGWYATQPPEQRAHADTVLDAVGELLGARGGASARYAGLRDRPGGGSPTADEAHRRAVLMAALALAEGPEAAGEERAPTAALA